MQSSGSPTARALRQAALLLGGTRSGVGGSVPWLLPGDCESGDGEIGNAARGQRRQRSAYARRRDRWDWRRACSSSGAERLKRRSELARTGPGARVLRPSMSNTFRSDQGSQSFLCGYVAALASRAPGQRQCGSARSERRPQRRRGRALPLLDPHVESDGRHRLHVAVGAAVDPSLVKVSLERGLDPSVVDDHGWTPLRQCSAYGAVREAQALLAAGAGPSASTSARPR